MKKSITFVVSALILTACSQRQDQLGASGSTDSLSAQTEVVAPATKTVIPERIGVSKMEYEFIAAPNCDGGECATVEYEIEILDSRGLTIVAPVYAASFCWPGEGSAAQDSAIIAAKKLHKAIARMTRADAQDVRVTLQNEEIIRIEKMEKTDDNIFFPPIVVLWQAPQY